MRWRWMAQGGPALWSQHSCLQLRLKTAFLVMVTFREVGVVGTAVCLGAVLWFMSGDSFATCEYVCNHIWNWQIAWSFHLSFVILFLAGTATFLATCISWALRNVLKSKEVQLWHHCFKSGIFKRVLESCQRSSWIKWDLGILIFLPFSN